MIDSDGASGVGAPEDELDLIEDDDDALKPDTSPEAGAEAKLTELGLDPQVSDVELEDGSEGDEG